MRRGSVTLGAALLAAMVLGGCAPAQGPAPAVTGGTSALAELTIDACPPGSGSLTARGSVRNSDDSAADYLVRVSWLDAYGSVITAGWDAIEGLEAGGSAEWSVDVDLGDVDANSCTAAVTRGRL